MSSSATSSAWEVLGAATYAEEGTYTVSVTVTDVGGQSVSTSNTTFSAADAALTAETASAGGTEEAPSSLLGASSNLAGTFSDANLGARASQFTAVIIWGDGGPTSIGTVSGSGSSYAVTGSHTYPEAGSYNLSIAVTDAGGSMTTITGVATVGGVNLTPGTASASGAEGWSSNLVGTFTDTSPGALASEFAALVTWGDGSPTSIGTVTSSGGGTFSVSGSHLYAEEGSYNVGILVADLGGSTATITGTATVVDAALTAGTATTITEMLGIPFSNIPLATFTDANTGGTISDFAATIDWGDGTPTSCGRISQSGTTFVVQGSHTYSTPGPERGTATVIDVGAQTTTADFSATIVQSIFVLNPTACGALSLSGNGSINVTGSIVVDSSSSSALSATGDAKVTASDIELVGGYQSSGAASLSPDPVTVAAVPDPLSGLTPPSTSGRLLRAGQVQRRHAHAQPGHL